MLFFPLPLPRRRVSVRLPATALTGHHLSRWQSTTGRASTSNTPKVIPDRMTVLPSRQLSALLDDIVPSTATVDAVGSRPVLPPGAHLVYFPPLVGASRLAPDGAEADHVPPGFPIDTLREEEQGKAPPSLPGRRLWAGGDVVFHPGWTDRLLLDGRAWTCTETIGRVDEGGDKSVVDIVRRYGRPGDGVPDISETRTLVFVRGGSSTPSSRVVKFPRQPTASHPFSVSHTHLFHFSALTYNAHFIHLDRSPAALVHGPLLLAMMLRALGRSDAHSETTVQSISYRNLAPLHVDQPGRLCVRGPEPDAGNVWDIWVEGPGGGMVARGRAHMDSPP
ncbi:MaoC like domain [Geosmithia morbida]|uniref:MaoC like domain n=1 Tax=Geosmithia morbida TaxID=1094350 RepID=A0A9P4YV27_9HYPO|nr:MaoC like domain [Geosmithia morbida]KAF4123057.1 MaoC like domain [Geosmithia morbida]